MTFAAIAWSATTQYLKDFSSIAGLSHAAKSPTKSRSIYWLIIFSVGFVMTVRSLVHILNEFFEYPVDVSSKLTTRTEVPFPAVTVCNLNRVHCPSIVNSILQLEAVVKEKTAQGVNATEESQLFAQLGSLAVGIDCVSQTCATASNGFNDVRLNSSADLIVLLMAQFGCHHHINPFYGGKMCYHLYQSINHDPSVSAEYLTQARGAWDLAGCTVEWACQFVADRPRVFVDGAWDVGMELVEICRGNASTESQGATARKRRQAGAGASHSQYLVPGYYNLPGMTEDEFTSAYLSLSEETRMAIGHNFGNIQIIPGVPLPNFGFFRKCHFHGEDCNDPKLWVPSVTPNFGNCFTFNSAFNQEDEKSPRNTSLTGSASGLTLELYVDQMGYMTGALSPKAGALFVIHNSNEYPLVNEFGTMVQPGTSSMIAMHMNDIELLSHPHPSECFDDWKQTDVDLSLMADNVPRYSLTSCQRYCQQTIIMRECDCFDTVLHQPMLNATKFKFKDGFRPCQIMDETSPDFQCVTKTRERLINGEDDLCPSCHLACKDVNFESAVTSAAWPSDRYWVYVAREFGYSYETIFDDETNAATKAVFQHNYLKANIYFKSLNVREIIETKKYSGDSALAALGGALSLFLGVAIIMLFEVLELAYNIVVNYWSSRKEYSDSSAGIPPKWAAKPSVAK